MYSLAVGSSTTAIRSKEILSKNGIRSTVSRYTGKRQIGCGYVVNVSVNAEKCVKILLSNGIKVLDVSES